MGVLNLTPDSFSDGGRWRDPGAAMDHALAMCAAGVDIIDIGGESTRPGAESVGEAEEIARTVPIVEALARRVAEPVSIDTMKPAVARAAFAAGATIWNDVGALATEEARRTAAELGGVVILMHMQGEPRTMQQNPYYDDVTGEVIVFLRAAAAAAEAAGVDADKIWVDPGIGFGKTNAHNFALMHDLARIARETGRKLAFGASRKSFIGRLDNNAPADRRLGGSVAAAVLAAEVGAGMVRVHDVAETVQALKLWRAVHDAGT